MKKKRAAWALFLGLSALLLAPSTSMAYFARDGFAPYWLEKKLPELNKMTLERYQVKEGDTLWSIANKTGISMEAIRTANGMDEDSPVYPGQMLILPAAGTTFHRVVEGETLSAIAREYGVTLDKLRSLNKIENPDQIEVGTELAVPQAVATEARSVPAVAADPGITLKWPLSGRITSYFGPRDGGFHYALDIAGNMGDPIKAPAPGRVVFAGWLPYYGNALQIDHGHDYLTVYGHTSKFLVRTGDLVNTGQTIALVGSTGHSTGPHLHFELRLHNRAIDPLPHLPGDKGR